MNKQQDQVSIQNQEKVIADVEVPKIVDMAFDFWDALQRKIHPPKSQRQLYIEAIKRTQEDLPRLKKHFLLPGQNP